MSELRKAKTDHPYFITLTVVGWIDVFTRERYCAMVIDSLKFCVKNKGLKVYAYVIMTNHIHLIVRQIDSKLNYVLRDLKNHLSRTIISSIENEQGESRKDWLLHMFR